MSHDPDLDLAPETMWAGKFVSARRKGRWEYAARVGDVRGVVILADHEGKWVLIEQPRAALGSICLELPAGLVGDHGDGASAEDTAARELEEETGFTAGRIENLGEFYSSPGMISESFTLVRAHDLRRTGAGGGIAGEEQITVHLVPKTDLAAFVAERRSVGIAVDVKLLLLLAPILLA